jgi:hypothetical protein
MWTVAAVIGLSTWTVMWLKARSADRLAATAAASELTEVIHDGRSSRTPSNSGLGLNISEENGKLHTTWDHGSPAANSALSGFLEIRDSGVSKNISLLPADITGGSIVYSPRSSDVTFRLVLMDKANEVSEEMVRFVGSESPVAEKHGSVPGLTAGARSPGRENAALPAPAMVTLQNLPRPEQGKTTVAATPVEASKGFVAPTPTATQRPVPLIVDAPILDARATVAPTSAFQLPSLPAVEPPRASAARGTAPVPIPTPPAQVRPAIPTQDPGAAKLPSKAEVLTQPVPLHRVQPINVGQNSWKVYSPTTIVVVASVDERGRVAKVVADSSVTTSANAFLVSLCLKAAKEWTFKPATRDGHAISGIYSIQFRYLPRDAH